MKKFSALIAVVGAALMLTACGNINATGKNDGRVLYKVTGKTDSKKVYWKTNADGESSVKTKNGKYSITNIPRRLSKYNVTVADNSNFKSSSEISVPAEKPIMSADDFSGRYSDFVDNYLYDKPLLDLSSLGEDGYHKVDEQNGVKLMANVNEGKLIGLELSVDMNSEEDWSNTVTYTLFGLSGAVGTDTSTMQKFISNTVKGKGQSLSIKSHGVTYESFAMKGIALQFTIFKK